MVKMRTVIQKEAVIYTVERADHILWARAVRFGKSPAHQAGGYAFQAAAVEQAAQATRAADPDERVEDITTHEVP